MKILCISIGTRGDIEPFAALAEILGQRGHEVVCAFPEQFAKYARESNARFFPMKREFLEMLDSSAGKAALGGGGSVLDRFRSYYSLYRQNRIISFQMLQQQKEFIEQESPDVILHSLKAFYPIYWHLDHPGKAILVSPIPCVLHPADGMASIFLNGKDYGSVINRRSYAFMRRLSMSFFRSQLNRMEIRTSKKELNRSFMEEKVIYTIADSLYPEMDEWPDHVRVVGYLERDKTIHWTPPGELDSFLEKYPEPLFITFGSMTNPDPEGKTKFILDTLKNTGIPAIINTAAGGLIKPEKDLPDHVFFVSDIPYDWIFPRVRAVIHHGGAGTTHLALKYGCASMIVPHIPDQHLWNRILSGHGVGPKGPGISRFISDETTGKINDLYENVAYRETAGRLGSALRREDHTATILRLVEGEG